MSDLWKRRYEALYEMIEGQIPGFKVDYKDTTKDWMMRAADAIVSIFNKKMRTHYTTTLLKSVYFPTKTRVMDNYRGAFRTLSHEYVHLWDNKHGGLAYNAGYLCPQLFALFSIFAFGAFWSLWFLFFLLFLVFLAPIPSPWRTKWELRGYTANLMFNLMEHGQVSEFAYASITQQFTSINYFRMCPDEDHILGELKKRTKALTKAGIKSRDGGSWWPVGEEAEDIFAGSTAPYRDIEAIYRSVK